MSVPALRQPKFVTSCSSQQKAPKKTILPDVQYVILTLKDKRKLVVSSDAYHGIITAGNMYLCVFCRAEMELDSLCKEKHKSSVKHTTMLHKYPHEEDYSENLIRKLNKDSVFCTNCSVVIKNIQLMRHLTAEAHIQELQKSAKRAETYKPLNS